MTLKSNQQKMNNDEKDESQRFFDYIAKFQFFNEQGWFCLEEFSVYLHGCLKLDGLEDKLPRVESIHELFLAVASEIMGSDAETYVRSQRIIDWEPKHAWIYPTGHKTLVHIVASMKVGHFFIADIGYRLLKMPEPKEVSKYFEWCDDMTFTHTYINRFHNQLFSFLKTFDRAQAKSIGFSHFEALSLAKNKDVEYDCAVSQLQERHKSYQAAIAQINSSIESGFYLEAIALEECFLSHCIHNFLENTGVEQSGSNFNSLIRDILSFKDTSRKPEGLFERIDAWRLQRNRSIHGYFTASTDDFGTSRELFQELSQSTALAGIELVNETLDWHEYECVDYMKHEFAMPSRQLH